MICAAFLTRDVIGACFRSNQLVKRIKELMIAFFFFQKITSKFPFCYVELNKILLVIHVVCVYVECVIKT